MQLPARRPRRITPPFLPGPLSFLLLLLVLGMPGGTTAHAEEKPPAAPAPAARGEGGGKGQKLRISCDLFSENPLNISVAADLPDFSVDLPTDNEKEFQTIATQSAWEGTTLHLHITILRQKYYQAAKDTWESRNIGIQQLPVSLKPGETVEPLQINGKALRISLVADPKPQDH